MAKGGFYTGFFIVAAAFAAVSAPARAETLQFKADLKPVAGTGSTGSGIVTAEYDTDSKKLTWRGSYTISTYATSGSFHGPASGPRSGFVRMRNIDSPFEGTAILSPPQGEGLVAGEWTVVIRTARFPKGELIGQVVRGN